MINGHNRSDNLDIVEESFREQWTNGTVNKPGGQDGTLRRAAFPTEPAPGYFPDRIHPFFVVDQ